MPALWSVAVGIAAFALYLWLAPPVSGDGDTSELTLALATGGVPHPTGYPLYIMLGHLFCARLQAVGASWPYAANAWSALGGGVAIGLLHAAATRLVPHRSRTKRFARFVIALIPSAVLALDPVWTMSAALVEIHSWHLAWVGGLCLLFVTLVRDAPDGAGRSAPPAGVRSAAVWGFACGLGLAHHLTSVLVALPLTIALWLAWRRAGRMRPRLVWITAGAALVPLLSYAFIAYRAFHPALYQWPMLEPSLRGVIAHAFGGGYGSFLGRFEPSDLQRGFLAAYVYPVLVLGFVGLTIAALRAGGRGERFVWWGLLTAALVQCVYVFQYGVPDPAVYFLPAMGIGLLSLPSLLATVPAKGALRPALWSAALVSVALLASPWLRVAIERRDGFVMVEQHLRRLWNGIPSERAIVLWPSDMHTRFREYQIFAGEKPDVFVSSPNLLTFDRPRRAFERRFGFDPLAGIAIRGEADVLRIAENVNRQTPLPVVVMDALGLTATVLPKGQAPVP